MVNLQIWTAGFRALPETAGASFQVDYSLRKKMAAAGSKTGSDRFRLFAHTKTRFVDDTSARFDFPGGREHNLL